MSKKIDRNAATAFKNKRKFNISNTQVIIKNGEAKMYLFDNLIAKTKGDDIWITNCNWFSVTTKNRLNAIGAKIRMYKGTFIINEKFQWDGNWIKI